MSRRELFGSLCAMVFLINLSRIIFAPLVQPAAAEFDVPAARLGIVTSAAWLGSAAPRLPTGYLLTYVPRHHVIAGTGVLLVGTATATGLANSVLHLTAGAFLMGLSSGMYFIAANPLVSELFPERVGTALGVHGTSSQVAAVVAPLVLSAILVVDDSIPLVDGWRATFFVVAGVAAASTVALVWAARRTDLPDAGTEDQSLRVAGRAQWPLILTGVAFIGATGFLWNALFNLYGDYLHVAKDIPPATGRNLLSLMFAAGVPAFLFTGRLADAVPNVPLLLGIVAVFAATVFALTLVQGLLAVALLSLVIGYVIHSLFPALDTYMLSSLPDRHRASAYALFSSSMMLVQALGSGVVGTAVDRGVGYDTAFQTLTVTVGAVGATLFVLYLVGYLPAGGRPDDAAATVAD